MSMLIAIDTATRFASIALYEPDRVRAEYTWQTNDNHTVELMPTVVEMMKRQGVDPAQLGAVAVSTGPGSFTGLRIGLAVGKGLALGLDIPLLGIPTLDILPYAVGEVSLPTWSIIQAGRGRLCYAEYRYHRGVWRRQGDFEVGSAAQFSERLEGFAVACGELTKADIEVIRGRFGDAVVITPPAFATRRAAFLADLAWRRLERGEQDDLMALSPLYLHHPGVVCSA